MLEIDLRERNGYWIHMAGRRMERALSAELAPEGITFRQMQVLGCLAVEGELSQTDLADRMNIEPPTLVRVLDCMAREGLIERCADPNDRRKNLIRPTAKAVPIWERIIVCADRVEERAARGLSDQDLEQLRTLLQRVLSNLEGSDPVPIRLFGKGTKPQVDETTLVEAKPDDS